ncbi:helix-turn-helix domain-containing protein [Reichenbachiella carrageenanivorans]|uniref:Helix-turn-helix domain-containing protein n=1 Tax=Reichenbachiella carrageenanivorans TaxID=2979869 RepID=A0ABY6CXT5_9BACT|nr:helix-turn-helix domain-containing protein [Reichenbachiella carrageenanivorans]UXX78683.1 helix-turn-helix domain-containing protein [Reichenbachiella carrageenanivorans]
MKIETKLRDLYKPIQPTVRQSSDIVTYTECLPDLPLREFIYCYWRLYTKVPLSEQFNYRVVSDGCIDIYFELNNPHENYVMGFCEKFTEFPLDNMFNYVGVRFLPTVFPQLFKVNAVELSNRYEHLSLVAPRLSEFISSCFNETLSLDEIKILLDKYFSSLISKIEFNNDPRLYKAIEVILTNHGMLDIEKDLDIGISARQLRRIFEFYVGDTAKTFSKVVRFQNLLKAHSSALSPQHNKLFFDMGYYDQSHFIKEFKNFYGTTPGKVFDP